MNLVYAAVRDGQVFWMARISISPGSKYTRLARMRVEQGGEVQGVLELYEALRKQPQSWWDSLNGNIPAAQEAARQILEGGWIGYFYDKEAEIPPKGETIPLAAANAELRSLPEDGRNLTVLLDSAARTLAVSAQLDLTEPDLTLPLDSDVSAVSGIRKYGVRIGYGLGTDEALYQRLFRSPWKVIARCLRDPDPGKSMAAAAAADMLEFKAHVLTEQQCGWSESEFLCAATDRISKAGRYRALYVPGVFGLVPAILPFVTREDGRTALYLPCQWDNRTPRRNKAFPATALELADVPGEPDPLLALAKAVDRDRAGLLSALRELTWTVHMSDLVYRVYGSNAERGAIVLAYTKSVIPREQKAQEAKVLPGTNLPLCWSMLEKWTNEICYARQSSPALSRTVEAYGDSAPLLFWTPKQDWSTICWADLEHTLDSITEKASRTGSVFLMKKRMQEALRKEIYAARTASQCVYLTDPTRPQSAARAWLDHDGRQFILRPETESEREMPVSDFCESGGAVYANRSALEEGMNAKGRMFLNMFRVGLEDRYMSQEVRTAIQALRENEKRKDELRLISLPAGWEYITARFRDGAIGVAYGPRKEGESASACQSRLYREAAQQPSENALCLL